MYDSFTQTIAEGLTSSTVRAEYSSKAEYRSSDGIVAFVHDILHAEPKPYQEEILHDFVKYKREAVRGPHGIGKTGVAAWIVLWGVSVFDDDTKVITTASAWRQLKFFLWPEIRKWSAGADWERLGMTIRRNKELLDLQIKLDGVEAFAVASNDHNLIEGAHASHLIYVFDEAKAIPDATWDAAEGAFSTGDCYALAISTPGDTNGRFYKIHKRERGYEDWHTRHVTLDEAIKAGRVTREWADQRKTQWGEKTAVYQNRVLGEFAASGEDSVIPLAHVEAANERWHELDGQGEGEESWGVDVARYGTNKTAIAHLVGRVIEKIDYHIKQSTTETTGHVQIAVKHDTAARICVDANGVGAGVFDQLREQGYENAIGINVGEGTPMTDVTGELKFINLRSAIWWMIRDALDPDGDDPIALPPDDLLTGDLTTPKWTATSRGQIKVESKDDINKRLGHSTDAADAVGMAVYIAFYQEPMPFTFSWTDEEEEDPWDS